MLRYRRQRQVPPPSPTYCPHVNELLAFIDRYWRKPNEPCDGGGHQDVLHRGL